MESKTGGNIPIKHIKKVIPLRLNLEELSEKKELEPTLRKQYSPTITHLHMKKIDMIESKSECNDLKETQNDLIIFGEGFRYVYR